MKLSLMRSVLLLGVIAGTCGVAAEVNASGFYLRYYAGPTFNRAFTYSPVLGAVSGSWGSYGSRGPSSPAPAMYGETWGTYGVASPSPALSTGAWDPYSSVGGNFCCRNGGPVCCGRSSCTSSSCVSATAPASTALPN